MIESVILFEGVIDDIEDNGPGSLDYVYSRVFIRTGRDFEFECLKDVFPSRPDTGKIFWILASGDVEWATAKPDYSSVEVAAAEDAWNSLFETSATSETAPDGGRS